MSYLDRATSSITVNLNTLLCSNCCRLHFITTALSRKGPNKVAVRNVNNTHSSPVSPLRLRLRLRRDTRPFQLSPGDTCAILTHLVPEDPLQEGTRDIAITFNTNHS